MTYCVGFMADNQVFLLADSITTSTIEPTHKTSTVGKDQGPAGVHPEYGPTYVEEAAVKIAKISDGCAIAIAGDAESAFRLLNEIREWYTSPVEFSDLLASLTISLDLTPKTPDDHFWLLIALHDGQRARLGKWSTITLTLEFSNDVESIGSPSHSAKGSAGEKFDRNFKSFIRWLPTNFGDHISGPNLLPCAVSVFQSFMIQEDYMNMGVGGVVCGCIVDQDGLKWSDDMDFIIINDEQTRCDQISVLHRYNGIVIFSSLRDRPKQITGIFDWKLISSVELANLDELSRSGSFNFAAVMRPKEKRIILLFCSGTPEDARPYKLEFQEDGRFTFRTSSTVQELLYGPLPPMQNPFWFIPVMPLDEKNIASTYSSTDPNG